MKAAILTDNQPASNGHSMNGGTSRKFEPVTILPDKVHETLNRHMLADGYDLVVDLERSRGSWIEDARSGKRFLDFFTFFGSSPIGLNHPKLFEPSFQEKLRRAAVNKPSSSDAYTVEMAEFVETFARLAMPEYLPHSFFIEGGALAVENAIKTAFDWKVRKNFARGYTAERGRLIMHFRYAFHGRSGYTMSLTNTDPNKTQYFPKFKEWPRIDSPYLHFPQTEANRELARKDEARAVQQMKDAFINNPDDIAAIIIEPIQAEGGDHHFSPAFFQSLRELADENEAMLIFDEVQTGIGLTGKMWAHEHFVKPDLMSFGKKTQVCGFLASNRVDEVHDNVFQRSSRLNSTFGGNLVDMLRCKRYLEIITEEKLVEHAAIEGEFLLEEVEKLGMEFPELVSEARGRGLMCAFDLAEAQMRDLLKAKCFEEGLILIGAGDRSIRFRPPLNITREELQIGLNIIREQLKELSLRDY
ncbi:MAG: L-lysine 6-transaminase [Bacteroidota bacterium]|nr:L-lysine 6-transaminase [Bacteroidota bacterium]MDP4233391.1 L-lysine 6-transaminase [Bacteroidota bacterium]MDP4242257.1 L-lysine 6-transaminase [Bacteroidota bacterium]MDP4287013.1 L-lysine 6-transaminase [Bacteroidota bacterium]